MIVSLFQINRESAHWLKYRQIKPTISMKIFNQISFQCFHLCGNVIKKHLNDLNVQAGMVVILRLLKGNYILTGNFPHPPTLKIPADFRAVLFDLSQQSEKRAEPRAMKEMSHQVSHDVPNIITGDTETKYVNFSKTNHKCGPVLELNLSLQRLGPFHCTCWSLCNDVGIGRERGWLGENSALAILSE